MIRIKKGGNLKDFFEDRKAGLLTAVLDLARFSPSLNLFVECCVARVCVCVGVWVCGWEEELFIIFY